MARAADRDDKDGRAGFETEQDINLGRTEDPVLFRIHRLSRSLLHASTAFYMREFDLGVPQVQILNMLGLQGPLVTKDIARLLSMNKGLVSRTLAELTAQGYTDCLADDGDARRRVWTLTARGRDFTVKYRPIGRNRRDRFLNVLTMEERDMLVAILDKLAASSEKLKIEEAASAQRKDKPARRRRKTS